MTSCPGRDRYAHAGGHLGVEGDHNPVGVLLDDHVVCLLTCTARVAFAHPATASGESLAYWANLVTAAPNRIASMGRWTPRVFSVVPTMR